MNCECDNDIKSSSLLFRRTDRLHRMIFEKKVVSRLGLHRSQHMLLMCLSENNGASQKELAEKLKISPAAVAITLNKLENAGYIERLGSDSDGRQNSIVLTEKAKSIAEETRNIFKEIDNYMISGVSEFELEIFASCLKKMYFNLENAEKELLDGSAEK